MKTKILKNKMQLMGMLIAFLILLTMQNLVAQVCTDPGNVIYGLTGTGEIHPITVSTGVVGAKLNPPNTGAMPDLSNAMGYNQLNGKFYYFKRNVYNAPQEFVSYDPIANTVTILANSPINTIVNLGCVTADGLGYYCIDALGGLFYYRIASDKWMTISKDVRNESGTSLSFIISGGSSPTPASRIYGDLAFDGFGNMWILISGPTDFGLYKLPANIPTVPRRTVTIYQQIAPTTPTPGAQSIGGIAFNSTGQMIMSTNAGDNKLFRINNNFSITGISTMNLNGIGTDLTSCNFPMYVLSVTWIDFTATLKNDNATLSWRAAEKKDNKGFAIEHSTDGKLWKEIGYTASKGKENSTEEYTFQHKGVLEGKHYYRIVSIGKNNERLYSITRIINSNNSVRVSLWPNPANDMLKIETSVDRTNTNGTVIIYDQSGRNVKALLLQKGVNSINIKSLAAGSYFVRINFVDGETVNQRFIKNFL